MKNRVLVGILGVVVGLAAGMAVNMAFILLNMRLHPPPEGLDWANAAQVEAYMAAMPPLGFILVVVAHTGQAFVGSLVGTLVSGRRTLRAGLIIGVVTLVGCVHGVMTIPAPTWFVVLDLLLPLPAAFLAARLMLKRDDVEASVEAT